MPHLRGDISQYGLGQLRRGFNAPVYSLRLHGHVFWEHVGDVIPGVAIETLLQPLLVQVVS